LVVHEVEAVPPRSPDLHVERAVRHEERAEIGQAASCLDWIRGDDRVSRDLFQYVSRDQSTTGGGGVDGGLVAHAAGSLAQSQRIHRVTHALALAGHLSTHGVIGVHAISDGRSSSASGAGLVASIEHVVVRAVALQSGVLTPRLTPTIAANSWSLALHAGLPAEAVHPGRVLGALVLARPECALVVTGATVLTYRIFVTVEAGLVALRNHKAGVVVTFPTHRPQITHLIFRIIRAFDGV